MNSKRLTIKELSERWGVSAATLGQWRWHGKGPHYLKMEGHICYQIEDVEEYERMCRRRTTSDNPQLIHHLGTSRQNRNGKYPTFPQPILLKRKG